MGSETEALVRSLYDALAEGDVETIIGALADDVRWTEAEGFPYAGTYTSPDAVLKGVIARLGTEWDGFQAVPERFVTEGDTVVAVGTYSGTYKETGKRFEAPFTHVWDVEGERVARFQQFTDTAVVQRALTD